MVMTLKINFDYKIGSVKTVKKEEHTVFDVTLIILVMSYRHSVGFCKNANLCSSLSFGGGIFRSI